MKIELNSIKVKDVFNGFKDEEYKIYKNLVFGD